LQLHRREAGGLHVIQHRNRDLSVGPDRYGAADQRVVPHRDLQHVRRPDHVIALRGVDGRFRDGLLRGTWRRQERQGDAEQDDRLAKNGFRQHWLDHASVVR
jgi:hypothetical protein